MASGLNTPPAPRFSGKLNTANNSPIVVYYFSPQYKQQREAKHVRDKTEEIQSAFPNGEDHSETHGTSMESRKTQ